ncbi:MAG: PH domain-containing protein, partial [Shewanella sp.]
MTPQIFELAPLAQNSILSFIILLLGLSGLLFILWLKQ